MTQAKLGITDVILRDAHQNQTVFYSIIGISWFWFIGITYVTQLPNYVRYELGGNEQVYILLLAMFSIGIGAGSFLCERLSGRIVEIGLVPLGALGLTLFGADIYFSQPLTPGQTLFGPMTFIRDGSSVRVMIDIVMLGVSGGIYIVPLYALVQQRSELKKRSRIIASNTFLNSLFMFVSSLYALFFLSTFVSFSSFFFFFSIIYFLFSFFLVFRFLFTC